MALTGEAGLNQRIDSSSCDSQHATEIAARFAAGDQRAIERVVQQYHHRLGRRVEYLLLDPHAADDVVQEVLVLAIQRCGQFRGQSSLETWLTQIAVNCCRAHWRRQKIRKTFWSRWWRLQRSSDLPDPAAQAMADERRVRVRAAVARLPTKYREVTALYYLEQMSCTDVADALRVTEAVVRQRLTRARRRLKQSLGDLIGEADND